MKLKFLFTLLVLWPALGSAEMYRWKDKNGVVQYTQTPPPGFQAEKVAPAPPPSANPGMEAIRALNSNADKARSEQAKKEAEDAKLKESRDLRCQSAKERASFMESRSPGRVATRNADGSEGRMAPEEYEKKLAEARQAITESCK